MADKQPWQYRRTIIKLGREGRAKDAKVDALTKDNADLRANLTKATAIAAEANEVERRIARRNADLAAALERSHTWIRQLRKEREALATALTAASIEAERRDGRLQLQPLPGAELLGFLKAAYPTEKAAFPTDFALAVPGVSGPGPGPSQNGNGKRSAAA